jgi:hypothetical protein
MATSRSQEYRRLPFAVALQFRRKGKKRGGKGGQKGME